MRALTLFLYEAIMHPSMVGALFPSSRRLAYSLTQQISTNPPGLVIELGAGTGAITAALIDQKKLFHQLIVIERSAKLSNHLTQRFPKLRIIQGDARQLHKLINQSTSAPIQAIVSSLPLRSLSPSIVNKIGTEINHVLRKGGLYIQYTYSLWGKPLCPSPQLKLIRQQWVWQNLPPARIDVFRHE
ncbi:class I SAM-dependent methyltransferase [Rickettsiella endosymbiont of Miltochrista miniata]|uniref:class I SAM-dependent methyltransferase n=1 Tax=Rickettsiella endosymbiont of Miltochrista miniata TaxID=3066239 RepID=UPI00313B1575